MAGMEATSSLEPPAARLEPPDTFQFPFQPYDIQEDFMRSPSNWNVILIELIIN